MEQQNKPDIFDRLMTLPGLRIFESFYKKNKMMLLYIFFGGCTTAISIASFAVFVGLGINELIANGLSWIFAVLFAYVTNRTWVFDSKASGMKQIYAEAAAFFGGRLLTLGMEEVLLLVFVTWLRFDSMLIKIAAQVVVLVSNYLISKWLVFRKPQ